MENVGDNICDVELNSLQSTKWRQDSLNLSERQVEIDYSLKYTIFPENRWIKLWDILIIFFLIVHLFVLPFAMGVSASVLLNFSKHPGWATWNIIVNACFFVDTFLYFLRAYHDKNTGCLVFRLDKIRKNYLKTYFVPNVLSCFPTSIIVALTGEDSTKLLILLMIFGMLRFLRFSRFTKIVRSSEAILDIQNSFSACKLRVVNVCVMMVVVAHWFACAWSFVAYFETQFNFSVEGITTSLNWINNWYQNSYIEGGINPLGDENFMDRYVLSLFWAVQTITSIGFGNILPVSRAEWWIACVLQLLAGFCWAFFIGAFVSAVDSVSAHETEHRNRLDQAQRLVEGFCNNKPNVRRHHEIALLKEEADLQMESSLLVDEADVKSRIMRYIHSQRRRGDCTSFSSTSEERYPVLQSLTPELRRSACYCLVKEELDHVAYLSSKYLTPHQQGLIAEQCLFLEFAAGDTFRSERNTSPGEGIFVFESGCAMIALHRKGKGPRTFVVAPSFVHLI